MVKELMTNKLTFTLFLTTYEKRCIRNVETNSDIPFNK